MPKAYDLPAEGQIDYLSFYVPVPFDKDVFVEKIEMKPSNKAVVHHETGWAVTLRDDIKLVDGVPYSLDGKPLDKNEVRPQGTSVFESQGMSKLICYVPGRGYEEHRPGTAKRIAAGKNQYIQFDVHYQPSGSRKRINREIGLWFSKVPVTHEVITEMVGGGFEGMRIVEGARAAERGRDGQRRVTRAGPRFPTFRRTPRTGRSPRSLRFRRRSRSTGSRRTCTCAART